MGGEAEAVCLSVPSLWKRLTLLSSERAFAITHSVAEKTVKRGGGVQAVGPLKSLLQFGKLSSFIPLRNDHILSN